MLKYFKKDIFELMLTQNKEVGHVTSIVHPLVYVDGLPNVRLGEVLIFETGQLGKVTSIFREHVEVLVFSNIPLGEGTKVARTKSEVAVPVSEAFLGKMLDPMGRSLYKSRPLPSVETYLPVENKAGNISTRQKIDTPLETGVIVVDTLVPLGKGQRELVIGDRKTGKTNFLLQTILNQYKKGVICIYAAIAKKKDDIKQIERFIEENNLHERTLVVGSSATDPLGVIYLTPYTAMTYAEYFRDQGNDVLIVLDDLSTHAKFYREFSLLGKNFPGRNSYPGDIFYTHSRLVERAGNFKTEKGVYSITCLPVAETMEGDISGYIQTNLMSMTDGHIYFDSDLFDQGRRPAVNFSLSVTRVGRQTQTKVRSGISRELNNFLTLYDKTQSFVHFGAELSEGVKTTLAMGDRVLDFFNQPPNRILDLNLQIMLFCLIWVGTWSSLSLAELKVEIDKVISEYEVKPEIREFFSEYVESAPEFNALLGRVSTEQKDILKKLGLEVKQDVSTKTN